jgi:hypothetical protein
MPRTTIRLVNRDRSAREIADDIRTPPSEPIRIRENHEGTSVARLVGDNLLVDWRCNLRDIAIRFYSSNECIRHRPTRELTKSDAQLRRIAVDLVFIHSRGNFGTKV